MRLVSGAAYLTIMVSAWTLTETAFAQQGVSVGANLIFYGDNTEFHNPFREGETIFGAAVRVDGRIEVSDTTSVSLGVFGNQRFGSESAFELVRPVLAMTVRGKRSLFVIGTLPPAHPGTPKGPDRTGPHGLLPPIQRETLAFDRPYEAGLEWTFNGKTIEHESWLVWQRLNTPNHRERLDAGARTSWCVRQPICLPLQTHIVHEGGQLFNTGPVRDSVALATGIVLTTGKRPQPTSEEPIAMLDGTIELFGLWSHYTPNRATPARTRDGGAFFGRASIESFRWRAHLIMFRGDDFIKDEGDPNYMSLRRNGRLYRGVRDYAEAGLTRTFRFAPDTLIEASFRYHRIEDHYEYSYRVLGVIDVRARIR